MTHKFQQKLFLLLNLFLNIFFTDIRNILRILEWNWVFLIETHKRPTTTFNTELIENLICSLGEIK